MSWSRSRPSRVLELCALLVFCAIVCESCAIDSELGLLGTYQAGETQSDAGTTAGDGGADNGGFASGTGGSGAGSGASISLDGGLPPDPEEYVLTAIIRDFRAYDPKNPTTNPDFENLTGLTKFICSAPSCKGTYDDREIITEQLGDDDKPVYKNTTGKTLTTHGKVFFDQWFRDVSKTNLAIPYSITLTRNANGAYEYDSAVSGIPLSATDQRKMFLPIDDLGFGNQGKPHNYSFTVELHTHFTYRGGEFFKFSGDDDLFVYIDKKLVINLGGMHVPEEEEVRIDTLGLTVGEDYAFDLFAAERHQTGSNIRFTTTLYLQPVPPR